LSTAIADPGSHDFTMHTKDLCISTKSGAVLLDGVTIEIGQGEHVALHGPSGAGKTLLATALCGLTAPSLDYCGEIGYVATCRKTGTTDSLGERYNVLRRHIGFVPQEALLDPDMTAEACILTPARLKSVPVNTDVLNEVCARLGIGPLMKQKAATLSGGQKQRVAIARAFANGPRAVVLDEPTAALNQELKDETNLLLDDLVRRLDITIVSVTHEASLAARRVEMADGQIISDTQQVPYGRHFQK
jgi:ABC-type lipoprotein export system ATPase subunit